MIDLDLRIAVGENQLEVQLRSEAPVVALVGPSGCGKSTLVRILAGVAAPASGRVGFGGVDWTHKPPWERDVGWVPQDPTLFPHLDVAGQLGFGARQPLGALPEALGISGLLQRSPGGLSGGERQRVALGRALLRDAALWLLDEPFTALDREARAALTELVLARRAQRGAQIIVVSHDEADLGRLGAERWLIAQGRVRREG